jgi:hypothetical protein
VSPGSWCNFAQKADYSRVCELAKDLKRWDQIQYRTAAVRAAAKSRADHVA